MPKFKNHQKKERLKLVPKKSIRKKKIWKKQTKEFKSLFERKERRIRKQLQRKLK